jgi:hypothetical protein
VLSCLGREQREERRGIEPKGRRIAAHKATDIYDLWKPRIVVVLERAQEIRPDASAFLHIRKREPLLFPGLA